MAIDAVSRKARLLLLVLFSTLGSLGLSGAASLFVVASNGLSGVPRFIEILVDIAFWPAMLAGVPRHLVFHEGLFLNVFINVIGYLTVALLLAAVLELVRPPRQGAHSVGARTGGGVP